MKAGLIILAEFVLLVILAILSVGRRQVAVLEDEEVQRLGDFDAAMDDAQLFAVAEAASLLARRARLSREERIRRF